MKNRSLLLVATGLLAVTLAASHAHAADQGISGKKLLLKSSGTLVLLSKDISISIFGSDPVNGGDSSISFDAGSGPVNFLLPVSLWSANGSATLFKYKNASAPGGPSEVKIAKVKNGLLKVVAKGVPIEVPNGLASINVVLSLDGGANTYCMTFNGEGDGNKFLVKDAVAGTCPPPCTTGQLVAGFCWFLSGTGESCVATCADEGMTCSVAGTVGYAGSSIFGPMHCDGVLDALLGPGTAVVNGSGNAGGCTLTNGTLRQVQNGITTCEYSQFAYERACACD